MRNGLMLAACLCVVEPGFARKMVAPAGRPLPGGFGDGASGAPAPSFPGKDPTTQESMKKNPEFLSELLAEISED